MIWTRILRAAAFAVCAAGALAAQDKVDTEFDPAVDFTRFKTFSFVPAANMAMSGTMKDPQPVSASVTSSKAALRAAV